MVTHDGIQEIFRSTYKQVEKELELFLRVSRQRREQNILDKTVKEQKIKEDKNGYSS